MVAAIAPQMPRAVAETCERMAYAIIDKHNFHNAMKWYDIEMMDLIGAGMERAVKAWQKFDPSRHNQPQTFLYPAIERGMRDLIRKEKSQKNRKDGLAWEMGAGQFQEKEEDHELADWLRGVYNAAKRVYVSGRFKQGRRCHAAPQRVAIALLMQHEGLSCRGCARFLAGRPDLKDILGIDRLPSYRWIWAAAKMLDKPVTEMPRSDAEVVTENN